MKILFARLCTRGVFALLSFGSLAAGMPGEVESASPDEERARIVHALDRLGYGPRPGEIERIRSNGLENFLFLQLHPEQIDETALEARLVLFDTLRLPSDVLMKDYFAEIKRFIENQRASGNAAGVKRQFGIEIGPGGTKPVTAPAEADKKAQLQEMIRSLPDRLSLRVVGDLQTAKLVRAVESRRQLQEVLVDFWGNHFNIDVSKQQCRVLKPADDQGVIRAHVLGKFRDLLGASAHSPAMLSYLDNNENTTPFEVGAVEQWIRGVMVKRMVGADIKPATGKARMEGGRNENYARELLELHTLGVDGGYTQKDVQEVGRCFTGWGFKGLTGAFEFEARKHDNGEKIVLGQTIPAGGGIRDGERVLDLLAAHPATAHFIALKLCRRLVADQPPASVVERTAAVFRAAGGDLREVVGSILKSPEFWAPEARRAKIKSPFEFAVSAVRALDGHLDFSALPVDGRARRALEGAATLGYAAEVVSTLKPPTLNWSVREMGQSLFAFQAPTGFPEDSQRWVNAGALVGRLNFALALTSAGVADVRTDTRALTGMADADDTEAVLRRVGEALVPSGLSPGTIAVLRKKAMEATSGLVNAAGLAALVLGSPEFQRH